MGSEDQVDGTSIGRKIYSSFFALSLAFGCAVALAMAAVIAHDSALLESTAKALGLPETAENCIRLHSTATRTMRCMDPQKAAGAVLDGSYGIDASTRAALARPDGQAVTVPAASVPEALGLGYVFLAPRRSLDESIEKEAAGRWWVGLGFSTQRNGGLYFLLSLLAFAPPLALYLCRYWLKWLAKK